MSDRPTSDVLLFAKEDGGWLLMIGREAIRHHRIKETAALLEDLVATPEATRSCAHRLDVKIAGYEYDPRELHSIGEVRAFVRELTEAWPYWLHACEKTKDSALRTLLFCLVPMGFVPVVNGTSTTKLDVGAFNKVVGDLFGFMNGLYAHHGLTQEENQSTTKKVAHWVNNDLGNIRR